MYNEYLMNILSIGLDQVAYNSLNLGFTLVVLFVPRVLESNSNPKFTRPLEICIKKIDCLFS